MDVCPSCGTIAPTHKDECRSCNTSFGEARLEAASPGAGLLPVRLCGDFDCRSCGNKVALNHFTLDGYLCGRCGIDQRFDWELWDQIITHAHNTADLTGFCKPPVQDEYFWKAFAEEEGEDIARMFERIGRDRSTLTKGNSSYDGLDFEMDVSPGNPVCTDCAKSLSVSADEAGVRVACAGCQTASIYALWDQPNKCAGLVGIIGHETRTDAPSVRTEAAKRGAAVAISCPNCSGALEVGRGGEVVVCPFCATSCHVPQRVWQQASGEAVPKQAWWMVFRGDSPQRLAVAERATRLERQARRQKVEREKWEGSARREASKERRNQVLIALLIAAGAGFLIVLNLLDVV